MNIDKFRDARRKKGYSQEELANLIGVSRQAVSKWESGQSVPETEKLKLISQHLDVSIDYLMNNESMNEQKVKVKFDFEDFKNQEKRFNTFEYKSERTLFGIPLIHVNFTKGRVFPRRSILLSDLRRAKGIIAVGDKASGVVSIGFLSSGIVSMGLFSGGLLSSGIFSLGLWSTGIISIGYSSIGVISIGIYALGIVAIAKDVAVGIVSVADNAIGVATHGETLDVMLGENNQIKKLCESGIETLNRVQSLLHEKKLPLMMRNVIKWMGNCR